MKSGRAIYEYESGQAGIILDDTDHNVARQNPADYIKGIEVTIKNAIFEAQEKHKEFRPEAIIGIGVDTTGSTPLPVDKDGTPLGLLDEFKDNPNANGVVMERPHWIRRGYRRSREPCTEGTP